MIKTKNFKSIVSLVLTLCMVSTFIPNVFAAQSNEYVDPAEVWLSSNSRTNELDVNATTTYETQHCDVCNKSTTVLTYRVPEYTRSGETALNRDVMFSDGTKIDGVNKGNLDDGTPGVDAYYTACHWNKIVCQTCGTINSTVGYANYGFNKNVYILNACDNNFYLQFDNTTHEHYDKEHHMTTLKRGEYCKFCKGTYARATKCLEEHNFTEHIDGQIGNNRFYIAEKCNDCGYETSEYVTAKSVVASYYGVEDGNAHTLIVNDLSDSGVRTSIRYGTSADSCTKTSAPNYTEPGCYTVYYEIDYSYEGEVMTENGVSYVWLVADDTEEDNSNETIIVLPQTHEHEFHYLETVKPSCEELGYERFQCSGCGELEKRNYTPATGHDYDEITIREATCKQGGLVLTLCADCGDFYQTTTATGEHKYKSVNHNPTCKNVGYTEYTCEVCGDNYINNIQPLISHSYERVTKEPTCLDKGYTTSTCTMCGYNYVDDYKDALGHDWDKGHTVTNSTCDAEGIIEHNCKNDGCTEKMIKATSANGHTPGTEATCTEPQICLVCETVLELPLGHSHSEEVIEPTCTAMGYTIFTCECGDSYMADYTDKIDHDYDEEVTEPTCTSHGFTTYTCECGDTYVSDYVDAIPHNHKGVVTEPTCTSMGYTTYTCEDCDNSYVGDYTDMLEHNYNKETVEPTCTEHGYAIYTCPDCGKSYIGDYKDSIKHTYTETVIAPTCTEMGYTIFKCNDCDDEYKGDYTDKIPHNYNKVITEPTCTEHGFTTFTCKECNDEYVGEYTEKAKHDYEKTVTEPTCTEFGFTTYSCKNCDDEYVADYTDKLAHNYGAVVTAPTCLTLGYTTYTCECGDTHKADYKEPLGHTPSEWIVDVPATIEGSGSKHIECTVCGETLQSAVLPQLIDKDNSDEDGKAEVGDYSIILTDENGKPIFNSELTIDVNDNVSIKLTNGRLLDFEKPTTITAFYTETQKPKENLAIYIEDVNGNKAIGYTNADGQLIVPNNRTNTNDDNGTIGKEDGETKETFVITVTDKANVIIPNCDIYIGESNNVVVDLPEGIKPTRENPVIVTITDHNGKAQEDVTVIALGDADFIEKGKTDVYGKITLPTSADGYTDEAGHVNVNELNVLVNDELGAIENAYVKYNDDNTITVTLPDETTITYANRITVTVTDSIGGAVKDKSITVKDINEKTYTALTDENGKASVPPVYMDYTDVNGYSEVDGFIVTVVNEKGAIEKAFITHNKEANDENSTVIIPENISVILPEGITFDYENRITVTVQNKADKTFVKGMNIIITETLPKAEDTEQTEVPVPKTLNDITDANGKVVFPALSEDVTDNDGNSEVEETKPGKGEDTDGDGKEDKPGADVTTKYKVIVADTKGVIGNSFIEIEDGKIFIQLPETHTLTTSNQTTVTVIDNEDKAVNGVSVTINDKTTSKSGTTDANGKVTLPVKTSSGGGGGGLYSGGGGGSYSSTTVKVTDKDGKTVSVTKSTTTTKASLTLPTGKSLLDDNYYTITVTSGSKAKTDYTVVLKDKKGNEVTGTTDKDGIVVLPGKEHKSYIVGYVDGTFRPDNDMSRAEASAIFARLIAEEKGETVSGKATFSDVKSNDWCYKYIGYLEKYDIIKGYSDGTFRPNDAVTRAEFVTMAVRYYALFNEVKKSDYTVNYTDLTKSYWAYSDIAYAKHIGWLNGYADGTFKGDNNITRAEVVTVTNHATERTPDEDYINKNVSTLNKFTDLKNNSHWAYYDILEAANTHRGISDKDAENWVK